MPWWLHAIDGEIWTICVQIDLSAIILWAMRRRGMI